MANACLSLSAYRVFNEGKAFTHITVKLRPFCARTYAFKFEFFLHYKIGALGRFLLTLSLLRLSVSLLLTHFVTHLFLSLFMVGTRPKNKTARPAAPVMSEAAKIKAGIPTKRRSKRQTKDDHIRELEARLAAFERPDEAAAAVSKEPLVSRAILSSPTLTSHSNSSSRETVALPKTSTHSHLSPRPRLK